MTMSSFSHVEPGASTQHSDGPFEEYDESKDCAQTLQYVAPRPMLTPNPNRPESVFDHKDSAKEYDRLSLDRPSEEVARTVAELDEQLQAHDPPVQQLTTFWRFWGLQSPFSPRYMTSPQMSPSTLGYCRLTIGSYALLVIVVNLIYSGIHQGLQLWFSYYTHISFVALCFYFFFAGAHSLIFAKHGLSKGLARWPKFLQLAHMVLQHTVCTYAFVVTVVFWLALSDGALSNGPYSAWMNISVHTLNSVFALFDIFSSRIVAKWTQIIGSIFLIGLYIPVVYITFGTTGKYVYWFFGAQASWQVAAAVGMIAAATILANFIVQLLELTREKVCKDRGASPFERNTFGMQVIQRV